MPAQPRGSEGGAQEEITRLSAKPISARMERKPKITTGKVNFS